MNESQAKSCINAEETTPESIKQHEINKYVCSRSDKEIIKEAFNMGQPNIGILLKKCEGKIEDDMYDQFKKELILKLKIPLMYKLTKGGCIVISEITDIETALNILEINNICDTKITSKVLIGTLCSKFVICGIHLEISLKDVTDILEDNNIKIIGIKRILKHKREKLFPTCSVVVTQIGYNIPDKVNVNNKTCTVRSYEDKPLFCKKCLRHGHREKFCTNKIVCNNCAEQHYYKSCTNDTLKCKNCGKNHAAESQDCEYFKNEVQILEVQNKSHVSREEVTRKLYRNECSQTLHEETDNSEVATSLLKHFLDTVIDKKMVEIDKKIDEFVTLKLNKMVEELNLF